MSVQDRIKRMHQFLEDMNQLQLDQAMITVLSSPKYQDPKKLNRYEHKVFSQSGEDGIIAEIFRRIGTTNKVFVECAPGNGLESNTLYLMTLGWTGLWIEANPKHARAIRTAFAKPLKDGALSLQNQFATADNIESLLDKASVRADFDFLSIDIDRNDYWIWQKIRRYHPRVVAIEYNAIWPPGCNWVVEYNAQATWDGTSNCGASLTALEALGAEKGYQLVGCTLAGTNTFFVREELAADHFQRPFTANNHYEPPRYYLTQRKAGHNRSVPCGGQQAGNK
jgi:hypothetical protein